MSSNSPDARVFFNFVGGSLTLLSLQLPWVVVNGVFLVSIQSGPLFPVAFYWILAGAILSFLSRFGGVMTLFGLVAFFGEPYASYGFIRVGEGVLLALAGAFLTLMGTRWAVPRLLIKGREIIGGILYSIGFLIILTIMVGVFVYGSLAIIATGEVVVQAPLVIVGMFMTVVGLRMFLSPERRDRAADLLSSSK